MWFSMTISALLESIQGMRLANLTTVLRIESVCMTWRFEHAQKRIALSLPMCKKNVLYTWRHGTLKMFKRSEGLGSTASLSQYDLCVSFLLLFNALNNSTVSTLWSQLLLCKNLQMYRYFWKTTIFLLAANHQKISIGTVLPSSHSGCLSQ